MTVATAEWEEIQIGIGGRMNIHRSSSMSEYIHSCRSTAQEAIDSSEAERFYP